MAKTWRKSGQTEVKFSDRKKPFSGYAVIRKAKPHDDKKYIVRRDKTEDAIWQKS